MNKKLGTVLIGLLLLTVTLLVFTHSKLMIETVSFSIKLWMDQLIPSLFPFFFLSEFFIEYGMVELLAALFHRGMNFFFHLKGETAFVLVMSMISGFPSGAKYTKSLYDKGIINVQEATSLLTFTHFSNPLFILGLVATSLLQNPKVGLIILGVHYGTNLLIGILFRPKEKPIEEKITFRKGLSRMHQKRIHNSLNFGQILKNAIFHTFEVLVLMLGTITFFLIIRNLLNVIIPLSSLSNTILSGCLEMTQGIYAVSNLALPLSWKASLITFFLSFGGLSVHMQVYSIISETKIKYKCFLKARIIHAFLSSIIVLLLLH